MSEKHQQASGGVRDFHQPLEADWTPDESRVANSRLLRAIERWGFSDLESFHAASLSDPDWFWSAAAADIGLAVGDGSVIDASAGKAFPRWFAGSSVNAASLCVLRHSAGESGDRRAVVYEGDSGQTRILTFRELAEQVQWFASYLASLGVAKGDRVVLFMPVIPEAVAAFLGAALIGAVVVPTFSGSSPEALAVRIRESGARVVVTVDGTTRRGKTVPMKATADAALSEADAVERVVVVEHHGDAVPMTSGRDIWWHEMPGRGDTVAAASTDFNDPVALIYTSGTTGAPKGIVHSHGGFALKAGIDFAYGFDIDDSDVVGWIADMGWMLGPLLVMGPLQLGATIVLMEGVPDHPGPQRIWDAIDRHGVTLQGFAPTAVRGLIAKGAAPDSELSSLRSFASTGEAWDSSSWEWLFSTAGRGRRPIINYSGGTETGGGILIAYPFLPCDAGEFNGPLPGMDVVVTGESGDRLVGEVGELAVLNTWPGMTHSFWGDDDRYLRTYWSVHEDVWVHGDLASVSSDGAWKLHGRSDDTMKIAGRRVGPAEIETALIADSRIVEAAVIGAPDPYRGERVVAFVVVSPGTDVDESALQEQAIANVGKSFAPLLHVVEDVPKTKNGKIMRRAIRARYLDKSAGDLSTLDPNTPLELIPQMKEQGE